ncbi:hypothetical protein QMG83_14550 [Salinibacterium sp. G-O1]|uniref:hypothetical protein n=1 Tax=Salinibacterium sp. G-O1 TaxID=3046208 RepID=UPI0024BA7CCE|nr:hypothetical protein [Salinibacterium sp. G-O1]MDJ0336444.1 hypothetical protein [Salinibacterium sp. G-O1]
MAARTAPNCGKLLKLRAVATICRGSWGGIDARHAYDVAVRAIVIIRVEAALLASSWFAA